MSAGERRDRVEEVLVQMGLTARMRHLPSQLSGGQQQRVAIARALVGRPQLLLADEPTGNLDTIASRQVLDLLETINAERQTTIVMVTHDPALAARARRKLHVLDGRLIDPHAGRAQPATGVVSQPPLQPAPGGQEPAARSLVHAGDGAEPGAQRQHLRDRAGLGAALFERGRTGAQRRLPRRGPAQRRADPLLRQHPVRGLRRASARISSVCRRRALSPRPVSRRRPR